MLKLTLVFALLISVCVVIVNSQYNPPSYSNWENVGTYVLDESYSQTLADSESAIIVDLNDPVANAQYCQMLADLLNTDLTKVQTALQTSLAPHAVALAQNVAWATLTDKNARTIDAFQTTDQVTLSVNLRLREINRANMYLKVLSTVADEMNFTLAIDNYLQIAGLKSYAGNLGLNFSLGSNLQCSDISALLSALFATPPPTISLQLLSVAARKQIIANLTQIISNFISDYTRTPGLVTVQAIIDAWLVESRTQFLDNVNRRVSTWAELDASFGDAIHRNVVKRIFDLADDYFNRTTEVIYVDSANVTKVATANPPYFEFTATVNLYSVGVGATVGPKLVNFLTGISYAYSHPLMVSTITSAAATGATGNPQWTAVIRVFAANTATFDPRDLTGDHPVLGINSSNTVESSSNTEFSQTINQNIRPVDIATATTAVNATILDQQTILATLQTSLQAAASAYNALPIFDYNSLSTQITAFTAEASFNLSTFRARAEIAATQVLRAHNLLVSKLKYDLNDQNVTATNLAILSNTLKRQFIILIATLNGTSRAGCDIAIPDFRLDSFGTDSIYNLTNSPACTSVANVLGQLYTLKGQMLTAIVVNAATNTQVAALTTAVNSLVSLYQGYEDKIQTTFDDRKNATELLPILQQVDFKERVTACIQTIANGTLSSVSYNFQVSATVNTTVTHTVTAVFDGDVSVEIDAATALQRQNSGLQLCLSIHIGGDLSYFRTKATGSLTAIDKRSAQQAQQKTSSSVVTDFSEPSSTSGASSLSFCFVFVFMAVLALFM